MDWVDAAMYAQEKRKVPHKITKITKGVSSPPKSIPYVNLQLDGNDIVACVDGDYDEALKLSVGDVVEFDRYGNNNRFARNLALVELAPSGLFDDPAPQEKVDINSDSVMARAVEIYIHEARQHAEFDPIRLAAIAVDVANVYKELAKNL